ERTRPVTESATAAERLTRAGAAARPSEQRSDGLVAARSPLPLRLALASAFLFTLLLATIVISAAQGPASVSIQSVAGVILSRAGLPAPGFTDSDQRIVE